MAVDDPNFPNAPNVKQAFEKARGREIPPARPQAQARNQAPDEIRQHAPTPALTPHGPLRAQGEQFAWQEMQRQATERRQAEQRQAAERDAQRATQQRQAPEVQASSAPEAQASQAEEAYQSYADQLDALKAGQAHLPQGKVREEIGVAIRGAEEKAAVAKTRHQKAVTEELLRDSKERQHLPPGAKLDQASEQLKKDFKQAAAKHREQDQDRGYGR